MHERSSWGGDSERLRKLRSERTTNEHFIRKEEGELFVSLDPRRTTLTLTCIALLLTALSTLGHALQYVFGSQNFTNFVRLFNVAGEQNIPTWYASALLLGCAMLATLIANAFRREHRPYATHWRGLALVLVYMSIDEAAELHELTIPPLQAVFNTTGFMPRRGLSLAPRSS